MSQPLSKAATAWIEKLLSRFETRISLAAPATPGRQAPVSSVCPLLPRPTPAVLAEVMQKMPPEALYFTPSGLALGREFLERLVASWDESVDPDVAVNDPLDGSLTKASPPPPPTPPTLPDPPPLSTPPAASPLARSRKSRHALHPKSCQWVVARAAEINRRLEEDPSMKPLRRKLLTTLRDRVERRLPLVSTRHLKALEALKSDMPNFTAVIERIRSHLMLRMLAKLPLSLPCLLLLGPPGIGKTHFTQRLAVALDLHPHLRSMAETTAGFVFTGGHASWGHAQMGAVARLLLETPDHRAPLLIVDEIDKMQGSNFSPEHVLLGLLENGTAGQFRDEYLDVEMDTRPMSILLTSNAPLPSGSPLGSRMTTVRVELPTAAQMPAIARAVDAQIREEQPAMARIFEPLSEAVVSSLAQCSPRAMRARLLRGYADAAAAALASGQRVGRRRLQMTLLPEPEGEERSIPRGAPGQNKAHRHQRVIPLYVDQNVWSRIH